MDGALYEMSPPPRHLALPVISRVKVMSNLNIAERRLPQDGRIQKTHRRAGRSICASRTLPTQFGEAVVLRVLDRSAVKLDLETLGMPKYIYDYLLQTIEKPNGIFIVTGPTGSGKTTTLYACLNKINTVDSKVLTAEDPVEYDIEGIIQVPMNESIGLTFARVLRAFLRQDPDRIMVGETRDLETAQIAIQASLTGHLVFTTLHTNDAPGAVTRLIDMGVEPFLISASLEGVLGQRLIRKICTELPHAVRADREPCSRSSASRRTRSATRISTTASGCDVCNNTGYKGRKGIYELLNMTDPIRELINQRAPSVVLKQKAIELGMTTLRAGRPALHLRWRDHHRRSAEVHLMKALAARQAAKPAATLHPQAGCLRSFAANNSSTLFRSWILIISHTHRRPPFMPKFEYIALDARGQESRGVVEAANPNDAVGQLRQAGYFPTSVIEEGKGGAKVSKKTQKAVNAAAAPKAKKTGSITLFQRKTVPSKTLMIFTRQLATLIDAGLPLLRGLNVLAKQEKDRRAAQHDQRAGRWRAGRQHLLRVDGAAPANLQQALHQHGEGGRARRRAGAGA